MCCEAACTETPLVVAHVADFCVRCAEGTLVRAHELDFCEESGTKCAELLLVR